MDLATYGMRFQMLVYWERFLGRLNDIEEDMRENFLILEDFLYLLKWKRLNRKTESRAKSRQRRRERQSVWNNRSSRWNLRKHFLSTQYYMILLREHINPNSVLPLISEISTISLFITQTQWSPKLIQHKARQTTTLLKLNISSKSANTNGKLIF